MGGTGNGRSEGLGAQAAVAFEIGDHVLGALNMYDVPTPEGADLAMAVPITPKVVNTRGGLQGGLVATLVDVAAGRAVAYGMPDGDSAATADLNIRYLSPVSVGPAVAVVRVLRRGRSLTVAEVTVHDEGRDVVAAIATLSFVTVPLRPGQSHARDIKPHRQPNP
ncbi:PaaI family thioesterase [Actinocorallia sp. A-T 12471]|uniref:PaaI family thioesterase n=1 Tax=Actinocorallia sp. A-T 12471 TaxID=3089813 RepID=UPI0029D15A9D|nr:PaaI family thioesterase [Actinocorallia sp. A-T 12471]MDX6740837.1 PaaI family thioesterase [Actinocorallia sp. A-T 12471]